MMIMIAPFFIFCNLLVRTSAQAEESPTTSPPDNFTALFLEPEVRNFVDNMIEKALSSVIGRERSLFEDNDDVRMLQNDNASAVCDNCKKFYTFMVINTAMPQIHEACSRPHPMNQILVNEFCTHVNMDITPAIEFLFGYLLDRSRSSELATAICADNGRCPAKALLNTFDKLTNPDRLVDLSKFVYCQHRPDATLSECSKAVLMSMTKVAARQVDAVCSAKNPEGAFEEFCSYYLSNKNFGRGQLVSFLNIFSLAPGHCADRQCG